MVDDLIRRNAEPSRTCDTCNTKLVAPSIHFGNANIDNEKVPWVCPACYHEEHVAPIADSIPPPGLSEVANIEAQIQELKVSGFTLETTRKAFEFWRRFEDRRKAIRKTVRNVAERTEVLRKLQELDLLCAAILRRFCEQQKIDSSSVTNGKGYAGNRMQSDRRRQWEHDADLIDMALRTAERDAEATERRIRLQSIPIGAQANPTGTPTANAAIQTASPAAGNAGEGTGNAKKGRGRRPDPEIDPKADSHLCAHWKAAKGQGANRESFAREKGISVNDLVAAMDRVRYRRRRNAE